MALSRVVSGIFNIEKCRDLEIRVRGHPRSSKVVPFDRLFIVSFHFFFFIHFYFHGIFYGSYGLIQIKMMMMISVL